MRTPAKHGAIPRYPTQMEILKMNMMVKASSIPIYIKIVSFIISNSAESRVSPDDRQLLQLPRRVPQHAMQNSANETSD